MISPGRIAHELGLPTPTPEQAAVICAPAEPSLVIAGAGAGKTETMAARVVWLVANQLVEPQRVLGLTFTRKAARSLAERVRARLRRLAGSGLILDIDPSGQLRTALLATEPTVLTYHAYAGRLVAEHGLRIPVAPGARLLTETASWLLAHRVVSSWEPDLDTDKVPSTVTSYVLALAGELAEHLVDPEDLTVHAETLASLVDNAAPGPKQKAEPSQRLREIQRTQRLRASLMPLVAAYAERKRKGAAMDFADQMALAAEVARDHPEVGVAERERFGAVLLDEYQDTGHAQRILLRSLFGSEVSTENWGSRAGNDGAGEPLPGGNGCRPRTGGAREEDNEADRRVGPAQACQQERSMVTAVGDPIQAIYGWRGASAANLARFATDFPRVESGRHLPARRYDLLTSFRNPPEVLGLANVVSEQLNLEAGETPDARQGESDVDSLAGELTEDSSVEPPASLPSSSNAVQALRAREGAEPGSVHCALLEDVRAERRWLAQRMAEEWQRNLAETGQAPTAAVLMRRRVEMSEMAAALREVGLPVEVVGLGGLLDEPEIKDLVSALRVLVDPLAGTAAMRLLTGSRWRLGAADVAALWARARQLEETPPAGVESTGERLVEDRDERTGLVDALDDPGPAEQYSAVGAARIKALGAELAALRTRLEQPLPELVSDVERSLLLDIEVLSRPGAVGRVHLDAFADVVTDFASENPSATLPALLDYLATAEKAEKGLEPGEIEVAADRVQLLTVHAAKGLEWQLVAVPHLMKDVFPARRKSSSWLRSVTELPAELRGDAADLPSFDVDSLKGLDRKELEETLQLHDADFEDRRLIEERRLLYVALTRAERTLFLSGAWWTEGATKPKGPSDFLLELAGAVQRENLGAIEQWTPAPEVDQGNPLVEVANSAQWPADPLGERRDSVAAGAQRVRDALQPSDSSTSDAAGELELDPDGWARDVDALLAERAAARQRTEAVYLPDQLSVSQLVALAADPAALARTLRRPLPMPPNRFARRGTEFHAWLEHRFGSSALFDVDELPGAVDAEFGDELEEQGDLEILRQAFLAGDWVDRTPHRVEVPFETRIAGRVLRGRMDAVFADDDGGWTVVDWKTGKVPSPTELEAQSVQLATYRLAWSALSGAPVENVRAAFHYVRQNHTIQPVDLMGESELRKLLS